MDELTQLLDASGGGVTTNTDILNQINQLIVWLIIPLVVFTTLFLIMYTMRTIRRRRVENAIFEIRDLLRTMQPPQNSPTSPPSEQIEAKNPQN